MSRLGMYLWFVVLATVPALPSAEQSQSCPVNINFSNGSISHWEAYTGNNKDGNGPDVYFHDGCMLCVCDAAGELHCYPSNCSPDAGVLRNSTAADLQDPELP